MLDEAMTAKKPKNEYNATVIGAQNLLFGFGSYKAKHYGDGALLTIGHLAGWSCLFAGVGVYIESLYARSFNPYSGRPIHTNKSQRMYDAGVGLMAGGIVLEIAAIIYGFVMPKYYNRSNILAYGNNSGLKFDLTYTSAGNIAPRISYVLRY